MVCAQDEAAFSISQALKANEDVRLTSLNLSGNFLTKLGQVTDPLNYVVNPFMCLYLHNITNNI